jgi:recombination protein RecR
MDGYSTSVARLIDCFAKLPGIGRKTASRLAFHVIRMERADQEAFAKAIMDAAENLKYCTVCQNISDDELCPICADRRRDPSVICVVERPRDIPSIERTREFTGLYHVLHGLISPIDGIGPDQLKVKELVTRVAKGGISEVIMATNPTVEGEATALYIARLLEPFGVTTTRLAFGLPVGGDLEYADEVTLSRAIEGRREIL